MDEQERKYHDVANIFPLLQGEAYENFKRDISINGLLESIWLHPDGSIIDGRNRHRACCDLDIKPRFRTWDGTGSLISFVVSLNLHRRHLNSGQRAVIALDILPILEEEAKERQIRKPANSVQELIPEQNGGQARDEAAEIMETNPRYISDAKKLKKEAPDLLEEVKSGEKKITRAIQENKTRQAKANLENIEVLEAKEINGIYDVIVIDPPWPMKKIKRDTAPNQVEFDYPTMTEGELQKLEIPCADACHVWLWTTHKHLPMAFRLLKSWGLKYICAFVWHKPGGFQPFGLPQYNCEFALYARKGSPVFFDLKDFPVCFNAGRGKHSEKPEEFYNTVSRVTSGRRLDMFSRRIINDFDSWGKEAVSDE